MVVPLHPPKETASMRTPAVLVLSVALALCACGKGDKGKEGSASVNAADRSATVNLGGGSSPRLSTDAPADLPAYAAVYPGAKVQSSVSGMGGETNGMMTFTTPASADEVMKFYKDRAAAGGLTTTAESRQHQARSFNASKPGARDTVSVTTAPDPAGGGTFVQITYG
jgi:dihydrodipicolinate reductase